MDARIKKIIELIKKTGDRFIVWETDSNEPYAMMSLADYEKLMEAKPSASAPKEAEAQLLERVDSDIAIWQAKKKNDGGLTKIDFATKQKNAPFAVTVESPAGVRGAVSENVAAESGEKEEDDEEEYFFEPVE